MKAALSRGLRRLGYKFNLLSPAAGENWSAGRGWSSRAVRSPSPQPTYSTSATASRSLRRRRSRRSRCWARTVPPNEKPGRL